ncbi:hypothetical protein KI387_021457, partial [Taxus chinensis]
LLNNCGHKKDGSDFVTSCIHVTCKLCLKSHVESVVENSIKILEPSYDTIRIQLQCPDQRCGMELNTRDLLNLLDLDTVNIYENWLRNSYRDLYGPISRANTRNCIKCQEGIAIKTMSSMKGKGFEIFKWSFPKKAKDKYNQLQNATSNGSIQCLESWVCIKCGFSWCPACGFAFGLQNTKGGYNGSHVCNEAKNYKINNIVADMELIYNEYTTGTIRQNGFMFHCLGLHSGVKKIKKVEKELDCRAKSVLNLLTNILKNQPIIGFSAHVLLSRENVVGQFLEYLMMNDSMVDICARSALYIQLADLLNTMLQQYPELLKMFLGSCSQTDISRRFHVDGNFGSDSSLIQKLRTICKQSKIILYRVKNRDDDFHVKAELGIAMSLLGCYEKLVSTAEKQASSTPSVIFGLEKDDSSMTGGSTATSFHTAASGEEGSKNKEINEFSSDHCKNVSLYTQSLRPLQFGDCPFIGAGSQAHIYSKHFDKSGSAPKSIDNSGVHNQKRMLHIAKEMASLATNLPLEWESSIYLRVDPVRMDLLKALIVGPKETPYQNGIFIFDIYLPPGYPQVPPKVKFLTTRCGTVRFNPNLYHNGTVCLSLLGTWVGPGWQPWKSTLLQVLVSIQSLILVADPHYNEPGFSSHSKFPELSEEENRIHRYNTLKIAILGALKEPDCSFKNVIETHFQHKKDEIENQCNEWITQSGGPTHSLHSQIVNTANEVVLELAKLPPL